MNCAPSLVIVLLDISGLETPQVSVNGGAKKLPKLSHPSKQREEEILSTPSDSARAKRNVETKLFSSAEKSNSIVGDDSVAMEESDNDVHSDAVERLVVSEVYSIIID